jgi:hypothetical protein
VQLFLSDLDGNTVKTKMIEDGKIAARLSFRMHVKCYRTTWIGMLCIGT